MQILWVLGPQEWCRWPEVEAMLRFAQARDPAQRDILPPDHVVWVVMDGEEILAAATTRLTADRTCVVVLVAGKDHRRWLAKLDERIGKAAAEAGATQMVACGRAGWCGALKALGWDSTGDGRLRAYSRALES